MIQQRTNHPRRSSGISSDTLAFPAPFHPFACLAQWQSWKFLGLKARRCPVAAPFVAKDPTHRCQWSGRRKTKPASAAAAQGRWNEWVSATLTRDLVLERPLASQQRAQQQGRSGQLYSL